MPLDAVFLNALAGELQKDVAGRKIEKITQPDRDILLFALRGMPSKLLISAKADSARLHMSAGNFENPEKAPMFCMLLRKHLAGAVIERIDQPELERTVDFTLTSGDAFGGAVTKHLIVEFLGRFSNIILTDCDGIIIECLKKIGFERSEKRQLLPGLIYRPPPKQDKLDFMELGEGFADVMAAADENQHADKFLLGNFGGLSPLLCRELVHRAYADTGIRLFEAFSRDSGAALIREMARLRGIYSQKNYKPVLLCDEEGRPREFSYTDITQYGDAYRLRHFDTFSELLEEAFTKRDKADRIRQQTAAITKNIKKKRDRLARKIAAQEKELEAAQNRERLRELGDIITANLHLMKKGSDTLVAADFYAPDGSECEIALDPLKSPQQNAAKYYKDYARLKTAEGYLRGHISGGRDEILYLDSVIDEIEKAETDAEVLEISEELVKTGYVKKYKLKKARRVKSVPRRFISGSGHEILVGKNNSQNDELTFKTAHKYDVWLHAQKIHGSHVVIRSGGTEPGDQTILEAAALAAWYSQGRESGKVSVDYTHVKNVKKPPAARPGMVIYTDYKTVVVKPEKTLLEKI
jgi:predicted ribosome quality control (RQC) complex YloA/Tae2 family protein